jgi:hypothetical protein
MSHKPTKSELETVTDWERNWKAEPAGLLSVARARTVRIQVGDSTDSWVGFFKELNDDKPHEVRIEL